MQALHPTWTMRALHSSVVVANWPRSSAASRWLSVHLLLSSPMTGCRAPSCWRKSMRKSTQPDLESFTP